MNHAYREIREGIGSKSHLCAGDDVCVSKTQRVNNTEGGLCGIWCI